MNHNRSDREKLLLLLEEQYQRKARNQMQFIYTDEGTDGIDGAYFHARDKYPKHLEFFRAGATYRERCARCANRIGKSYGMGGYETALHVTGLYPDWWEGRRFHKPVSWWAAGKTNETTRDIIQSILLGKPKDRSAEGPKGFSGTGLIPGDYIGRPTWKSGVADLVDTIKIKHVTGGWSDLGLKSYHQGRSAFEGTQQDGIWFDEEPPMDVYGEALIRTATTDGIMMITFTPLEGMSEVVMQFLPEDQRVG